MIWKALDLVCDLCAFATLLIVAWLVWIALPA